MSYLESLARILTERATRLPADCRELQAAFLEERQNPDGGFSGREGGSDLYYTGFGLRSLSMLGALTPEVAGKAAGYLKDCLSRQASVVDFFSLLYTCVLVQLAGGPDVLAGSPSDWPERVAGMLESFRTPDGGYAKSAGSVSGSTYHTFLVGLTYQLLGGTFPEPARVEEFTLSRRREDGGFVEIAPMRRSGTNPTAAAVGILQMLSEPGPSPLVQDAVAIFLAEMVSVEGGLRANGRAPLADLLSTFTGCWTLHQLGGLSRINTVAVLDYARSLELPQGGFRAGLWDDQTDVEYTFYGLGVLSLLAD